MYSAQQIKIISNKKHSKKHVQNRNNICILDMCIVLFNRNILNISEEFMRNLWKVKTIFFGDSRNQRSGVSFSLRIENWFSHSQLPTHNICRFKITFEITLKYTEKNFINIIIQSICNIIYILWNETKWFPAFAFTIKSNSMKSHNCMRASSVTTDANENDTLHFKTFINKHWFY